MNRRRRQLVSALLLAGLAFLPALGAGGCAVLPGKPKDLPELRRFLLEKAKQKYKHALRITERHSPDPFNQAREQLVYTLIELGEFEEAETTGRNFAKQKLEYIEAARSRLAEVELDWKKEVLAKPEIKGSRKELVFIEAKDEWEHRIRASERQVIGLSLLLGEVLMRREKYREAVGVFREILDIVADHNTALRRIGQAYAHLEDHTLSASYLEKAHDGIADRILKIRDETLDEKPAPSEVEPGEVKQDLETPRRVRGFEEQLRLLGTAQIEIASVVAMLYFLSGAFPRTEDWFQRAFEIDPTCVTLDLKVGLRYLRESRFKEALQKFSAFRLACPDKGGSLVHLLLDRIEKKHFKE